MSKLKVKQNDVLVWEWQGQAYMAVILNPEFLPGLVETTGVGGHGYRVTTLRSFRRLKAVNLGQL